LGEGIVNYFEVKNCSEILVFEAVGSCNRFLMLNLGLNSPESKPVNQPFKSQGNGFDF
jgi:hypothetical protein